MSRLVLLIAVMLACIPPGRADDATLARAQRAAETTAADAIRPTDLEPSLLTRAAEIARAARDAAAPRDLIQVPLPDAARRTAPTGDVVYVFASMALGEAGLRTLFSAASGRADVVVVFRGPLPNEKIPDCLLRLNHLMAGLDPRPRVAMDPERFLRHQVEVTPVMVMERDGTTVASVTGLMDPDFLVDQVDNGKTGDLGTLGPVTSIAEPDLFDVIGSRITALDFATMKARAMEKVWRHVAFLRLPTVTMPRRRQLDPTIEVVDDILLPNGTVLARAGDRVNPLDKLPFGRRLVVFDATDPRQVAMAKSLGEPADGKIVRYLITDMATDDGWTELHRLESVIGDRVFVLPATLRDRFDLEAVPAVVEAEGGVFVVTEVAPRGG